MGLDTESDRIQAALFNWGASYITQRIETRHYFKTHGHKILLLAQRRNSQYIAAARRDSNFVYFALRGTERKNGAERKLYGERSPL